MEFSVLYYGRIKVLNLLLTVVASGLNVTAVLSGA